MNIKDKEIVARIKHIFGNTKSKIVKYWALDCLDTMGQLGKLKSKYVYDYKYYGEDTYGGLYSYLHKYNISNFKFFEGFELSRFPEQYINLAKIGTHKIEVDICSLLDCFNEKLTQIVAIDYLVKDNPKIHFDYIVKKYSESLNKKKVEILCYGMWQFCLTDKSLIKKAIDVLNQYKDNKNADLYIKAMVDKTIGLL